MYNMRVERVLKYSYWSSIYNCLSCIVRSITRKATHILQNLSYFPWKLSLAFLKFLDFNPKAHSISRLTTENQFLCSIVMTSLSLALMIDVTHNLVEIENMEIKVMELRTHATEVIRIARSYSWPVHGRHTHFVVNSLVTVSFSCSCIFYA